MANINEEARRPGQPVEAPEGELEQEQAFSLDGDYESLLDDYTHFAPPEEGEILPGHVLKVTDKEVIVDFGYKSEGMIPLEEFVGADGQPHVQRGDTIDVMVDRHAPRVEGYVTLSHKRAARIRVWDTLDEAASTGQTLTGRVTGRTKGGLTVDVGVEAFLPASQLHTRPVHRVESFVGQDIPVKIVKLNRRRGNVVVSRRLAIADQEEARKTDALEHIQEGAVLTGVVKNLTDYGAFVDLGGIDGLLHVSDISYGRIRHASEALHVGDEITVKVLKFDRERERISLGMKQIAPDPWEAIAEHCPMGSRVIGRVVSVTDYGAFVELQPGVEGLIHISEMTWSRRMKHPSRVVHVGDEVEAVVLEIKPKERRISLGIKQLEADPWTTVADRYSIGSVVEGRVRKITDFGAFIEIEEGIDGLVHISDLSWTKRVGHPSEILKKGQLVQAAVLHIDAEHRRLSLGVKQLQPDAWETFFRAHHLGDVVRGRVCRASNFGVFVEVAPGVEGLCHNSEIPGDRPRGDVPLPIGEELDFKIIKLNEAEKRIGLSVRAAADDHERSRLEGYHRHAAAATQSIEDIVNAPARRES
jgi:small subunit ribosomal protein S1